MSIAATGITAITTSPAGVIEVQNSSNVYSGTIQLYATVTPSGASNTNIIWSSSNKNIATVSSTGLVTSVFKGPVTITATTQDGSYSTSYNLKIMMAGTIFSGTLYFSTALGTNILYVGETGYVTGYSSTSSPKFVSSNTSVLTVDTYTGAYNVVGTGTVSVTITDYTGTTMLTSVTCTSYNTTTSSYIANTTNPNDKFNIVSVGSSISIEAKNPPAEGVITWSSDNTAYATVTSTGNSTATVAAISAPTSVSTYVTITGYNGGWVYNLFVRIPTVRVTGITGTATGTIYTSAPGGANLTVQPTSTNRLLTLYAIPSDPTILMPTSGNVQVIGLKPGVASVTYTTADGGYTFTKTYTVNGKNPTETIYTTGISSISTPDNVSNVIIGSTLALSVSASPSNATNKTISWSSSNTSVATVNYLGVVSGASTGSVRITASTADGFTSTIDLTVTTIAVTGISAVSGDSSVAVGSTITLSASVTPGDATNQTITWSSGSTGVATVDSSTGVVTGVSTGSVTITATTADGSFTATKSITVFKAVSGISTVSGDSTVVVGSTITLSASVTPGDATNQTITWSSGATGVATVDSSTGVVTGVSAGSATITATTAEGTHTATKSITVTAAPVAPVAVSGISAVSGSSSVVVGSTITLSASVSPADATNQTITWSSGSSGVATVDSSTGVVTGIAAGSATITATTADGNYTATKEITVIPVLTGFSITYDGDVIDYTIFTQYAGQELQFYASPVPSNATMPTISWSSSDETVATVNSDGLVTAVAPGTVTITVSNPDGTITASSVGTILKSASDLTITTASGYSILRIGQTLQLIATPTPSDAAGTVEWSSDNEAIATVSSSGLVTCVTTTSNINAIISCTMYSGSVIGKTIFLLTANTFTGFPVPIFSITDNTVGGFIHAGDEININRTSTVSFQLGIQDDEGYSGDIAYSSSNTAVLTKATDKNGNESATIFSVVGTGTSDITAAVYGQSITQSFTVVDETFVELTGFSVAPVSGGSSSISYGSTVQLTTTPIPADASYTTPHWSIVSTTSEGASIDTYTGVLTGGSTAGEVVVSAYHSTGATQEFTVSVSAPTNPVDGISAITATDSLTYVAPGSTLALSASVSPVDAGNQTVNWSSSNTSLATVSSSGVVFGVALGNVTITATAAGNGEFSSTYTLRVGVPVSGISGISGASSVIKGRTTQLTSGVVPSNASVSGITWSSSAPEVATVNSSTGLVTAVEGGDVTIYASTVEGKYATEHPLTVIVLPQELSGISDPNGNLDNIRVPVGGSVQFSGIFVPENTTNKAMTWQSYHTQFATVDASGLVTGVARGVAGVVGRSSQNSQLQRTATVTVYVPATGMNPITHSAASDEIQLGTSLQLSCDGVIPSNADNTRYTWSTSHPSYVAISRTKLMIVSGAMPDNSFTVTATSEDGSFTASKTFTIYRPIGGVSPITAPGRAVAVALNNTLQLTLPIQPSNATIQTVTWTSSNTSKVSVSSTGLCTGTGLTIKKEVITITASITEPTTNTTFTRTYPVTVPINKITGLNAITIVGAPTSLINGQTYQFNTAIAPSTASYASLGYTWLSANTAIGTISSSGLLTIVGPGKSLKITAVAVGEGAKKKVSRTLPIITLPSSIQTPVATTTGGNIVARGKKLTLKPVVLPASSTNKKLSYASSDDTIATVTTSGVITGLKIGSVIITITSLALGSVSQTVNITVY